MINKNHKKNMNNKEEFFKRLLEFRSLATSMGRCLCGEPLTEVSGGEECPRCGDFSYKKEMIKERV